MNEIDKYIDVGLMGLVAIMAIPIFLFLMLFALVGYIICKLFKIDADEIANIKDTDYE